MFLFSYKTSGYQFFKKWKFPVLETRNPTNMKIIQLQMHGSRPPLDGYIIAVVQWKALRHCSSQDFTGTSQK